MAAFEFRSVPTFRELNGRFARASRDLLENRRALMREQANRFVQLAHEEAPGGPGRTVAQQVSAREFVEGAAIGFRTTTGPIALYHILGTGLYGPKGRRIRPVRASALRFAIQGRVIFRASVRGIRPNKFLGRAYRRWLPGARADLRRIATRYSRTLAGQSGGA